MTQPMQKRWLLILTIGLGTLLNPLNSSMISVALTTLQNEFSLTFADATWMISVFYLASAAGQPVMGKLSDMFGPKRLFLAGLFIVAVSSVLAPFSPNYPFLLGCRALQAIGSSTLFPSGMAMVRTNITKKQAQTLAILSIFSTTSAAFGPSIGGFLIASWDWPAIFLVNFPFIVISFALAIFVLPSQGHVKVELHRIDFFGIFLFIVSIIGMILFLLSLEDTINWVSFVICIVGFIWFYLYERKKDEPFIDVKGLKKNRNATSVYVQFILINLVYYGYFYGFPTFLQQVQGYSERDTGLIMLALAGFGVLTAPIAGRMIDHLGSKVPLLTGAGLLFVGTILLLTYQSGSPLIWFIVVMSVLGMSNGFNNISMQTALYEHTPPEETGSASGLFQTSRYIGAILSSSLLGIVFNKNLDLAHLHLIAVFSLVFTGLVIFLGFRLPGAQRNRSA